jgi:superfamily II DNA or RNA helicase
MHESVRFTVRDPQVAYRDRYLWVPKKALGADYAANACQVITADGIKKLWLDSGHHYVLPREAAWSGDYLDSSPNHNRIHLDHTRIKTRDAKQEEAWCALRDARGGILNLACGKGKTVLALKKIAYEGWQACVVVGQEHLIGQWKAEAINKLGLPEEAIGIVQQKQAQWDKPIVLAMLHTLSNRAEELPLQIREGIGTVIFDECHHLSAPYFLKSVPIFYGNRYGLTATPEREDGTEIIYKLHIGDIFYSDLEHDVPAHIYFQQLDTVIDHDDPIVHRQLFDKRKELNYSKFCSYIGSLRRRNEVIASHVLSAVNAGRKVLVLGSSVSGLKNLRNLVSPKSTVVYADTPAETRASIIASENPAFATIFTAKEALDVPEIDTVMFVTPFKAWGAWSQGIGRAQRRLANKKTVKGIMFEDRKVGIARSLCDTLKASINSRGFSYTEVGQ